jgi:hypothetical protein
MRESSNNEGEGERGGEREREKGKDACSYVEASTSRLYCPDVRCATWRGNFAIMAGQLEG